MISCIFRNKCETCELEFCPLEEHIDCWKYALYQEELIKKEIANESENNNKDNRDNEQETEYNMGEMI